MKTNNKKKCHAAILNSRDASQSDLYNASISDSQYIETPKIEVQEEIKSLEILDNQQVSALNLMNQIEVCGSKITSATKFIDFFVHDILDYTLLN